MRKNAVRVMCKSVFFLGIGRVRSTNGNTKKIEMHQALRKVKNASESDILRLFQLDQRAAEVFGMQK